MPTPENSVSLPPPVTISATAPEVSVIVGTIDAARSIRDCLRSVTASLAGMNAEVIVADASDDGTANIVEEEFPAVTLMRFQPGLLTPRLWAAGLAQANGLHIAFMTGHSTVPVNWARDLMASVGRGVAGAGGPLVLSANSSLTDAAIYFLRYSAFMPSAEACPHPAIEIAGDNAVYRGDILRNHSDSFKDGFWEVPFHHHLRAEGHTLMMVPAAAIDFGRSFTLGAISSQRFAHGRHFGNWRASVGGASRIRIVIVAPVVPFVLLARIGRRVINAQPTSLLARFAAASPLILWLGICWALGEARGAWES